MYGHWKLTYRLKYLFQKDIVFFHNLQSLQEREILSSLSKEGEYPQTL